VNDGCEVIRRFLRPVSSFVYRCPPVTMLTKSIHMWLVNVIRHFYKYKN